MGIINYPYGIKMAQSYLDLGYFLELVWRCKVATFVELGVHVGGMAAIMSSCENFADWDYLYLGVELDPGPIHPKVKKHARIIIGSCFDGETVEAVKNFVHSRNSPAVIYCDDGEKKREVVVYEPILRSGDFIFAHDYNSEIVDADVEFLNKTCDRLNSVDLVGTGLVGFRKR